MNKIEDHFGMSHVPIACSRTEKINTTTVEMHYGSS